MKYLGACVVASLPAVIFGLGVCRAAARADAAMAQQTLPSSTIALAKNADNTQRRSNGWLASLVPTSPTTAYSRWLELPPSRRPPA